MVGDLATPGPSSPNQMAIRSTFIDRTAMDGLVDKEME
jgi:hypothetical protein